jgi:hypothetical protein
MRWVLLWVGAGLLIATGPAFSTAQARNRDSDVSLYGPAFQVGGLKFTIPSRWISVPADNPARVGQWRVPPPRGQAGSEAGEVVVFFFGPGVGGDAKENIDAWMGTMFDADGHAAAAEIKNRQTNSFKISQLIAFGTYHQVVPIAGIPPVAKPGYGLIGTVIENSHGNIYWRFTGPEPLVTADLPLFNKIVDSVKMQDKP